MSRDDDDNDTGPGISRLDRWLFAVRLFKSRSMATEAVTGGKVHLNDGRVKASHVVKPGDTVAFTRNAVAFDCVVTGIPVRRGPAAEAARCYEESEASKLRRERFAETMRMAGDWAIRDEGRPDKHGRRQLRQLKGRG